MNKIVKGLLIGGLVGIVSGLGARYLNQRIVHNMVDTQVAQAVYSYAHGVAETTADYVRTRTSNHIVDNEYSILRDHTFSPPEGLEYEYDVALAQVEKFPLKLKAIVEEAVVEQQQRLNFANGNFNGYYKSAEHFLSDTVCEPAPTIYVFPNMTIEQMCPLPSTRHEPQ
ncbi:MAG: hypothetical protein WCV90_07745 [Candidatus Woesearchaeota archaeon]|jgi:hypothetical protein